MEISSLCIVNENYDNTKFCVLQNSSPDSVSEHFNFIPHKETSGKFKEERNLNANTSTKTCNGKAIFIYSAVVWTLTIIVVTICILMFMEVL